MNRLRNSTLSSMGIKSFFMLRRMAGDQVKAPLPGSLQQRLDMAFISKDLPL